MTESRFQSMCFSLPGPGLYPITLVFVSRVETFVDIGFKVENIILLQITSLM